MSRFAMSRFAIALLSLWIPLVHAVEEEQPQETSTIGIIVFVVALVVCVAIYVWYTWKNEKKPEDEKLGDKF